MNPQTVIFAIAMLACPLGMGLMMWLMMRNSHGQSDPSAKAQTPAERLAALRAQRQQLESEISETSRIAELETQREASRP